MSRGSSYGAVGTYRMLFDIIAKTVEKYGVEGFDSQALYETAQSWRYSWGDRPSGYNYSSTKRYMLNDLCIHIASAELESMVRYDPDWYPILTEP